MSDATFVSNGAVSRPSNNNQRLVEHRKMGGLSFDVRWGIFVPFDEELVGYQEPHPAEVSNVGTLDISNQRPA
ncbi:MAG TPA: hypothetical protein VIY48_11870 [Candidatus Paceibacterota bacterium]